MPRALIITAEYDPLRDDGEEYAARLWEADVPVVCTCYPGVVHGFLGMAAILDQGKQAIQEAGWALKAAFGEEVATAAGR